MIYIFITALILLVGVYGLCRPSTIYDADAPKGYVVFNKMTDLPAYSGRVFRSLKRAEKAATKVSKNMFAWTGMSTPYEIRRFK